MRDLLRDPPNRRSAWARPLLFAGAALAFVAGIVAWVIPVVTGVPFLVLALVLLGLASKRARGWINRSERRLPLKWRRRIRRGLLKVPFRRLRAMVSNDAAAGAKARP